MADYLKPNAKINAVSKNVYTDLDMLFKAHPLTGDVTTKKDSEAIKRSVRNIVLTNKFERPFKPNFGASIRNSLFELKNNRAKRRLEKDIVEVLVTNEPRIRNVFVEISDLGSNSNHLDVRVFYNIINGLEQQTSNFTVTRVR
tara:strand:+ start:4547 stop:4975 length:429 start_codon:yes stop_codon:yes gene_type:complete